MESESFEPLSQETHKSKGTLIQDEGVGDTIEIQDIIDKMSTLVVTSTTLTLSKMHDYHDPVESDSGGDSVQLPVQEASSKNLLQNSTTLSNEEKVRENVFLLSNSQTDIHIKNPANTVKEASSKNLLQSSGVVPNEEKVSCENVFLLSNSQTEIHINNTGNTKRLPVKDVGSQKRLNISNSSVPSKKESAGSKNPSPISASERNIRIKNLKPILTVGAELPGYQIFQIFLARKLKKARMLPLFALEYNDSKSERNRCLVVLEAMKFIGKWLDQIEEMNNFNTKRYTGLISIILNFNNVVGMLDERLNLLSMARRYSYLETQDKESEHEKSVLQYLQVSGERLLGTLETYKRHLDAKFIQYNRDRMLYMNSSIQATKYPMEEKLLQKTEHFISLTNDVSMLLNKTSAKLVESSNFIDYFSCSSARMVNRYFSVIDRTFSA